MSDMATGRLFFYIFLFYYFQHIKAEVQKPVITVSHIEKDFLIICQIPGPAGSDTTCNMYGGDQSQILLKTVPRQKKKSTKSNSWFCQFTVTEDVLIRRLQSVRSQEVRCDYRVSSGSNSLSPRSDGYDMTVFLDQLGDLMISDPTTKQTSSTAGSTVSSHLDPKPPGRPTTSLTSPLTSTATTSGLTASSTLTSVSIKSQTPGLSSSLIPSTAKNPTTAGLTVSPYLDHTTPDRPTTSLTSPLTSTATTSGLTVSSTLTSVSLKSQTEVKTYSQRSPAQQDEHNQHLVKGDMRTGGLVDSEDDGIYSVVVYINVQ
ncbi:hypothetical protein DPEC_G00197650 [Dallia pectoralis]|uniref:Uncharacterized protein n=1 Tax=Dallia pectoralis TaxID=75939 RepID=A0ACC2G8C8_DALPE|nr:hypothetical protein DPEC_G00197650 [Dallia pectoralis]